ncbi:MAG TPA: hypothetical protein VMT37_15090 [Solirubrobacterales bacterium]|nr:hypothetical protein [Solirubrobacterales bacterium]
MLVSFAIVGLGVLIAAPSAGAAISTSKWESLTCAENKDLPATLGVPEIGYESTLPAPTEQCTTATTGKQFTLAGGHPNWGITDFRLTTFPAVAKVGGFPTAFVKEIVVDTPEGLSVNPEALPQCAVKTLEEGKCSAASQVGVNYLTVAAQSPASNECLPAGECLQARVALPVYNLVPFQGVPSMVGFRTTFGHPVFIVGSLSPKDQHVTFTISNLDPPGLEAPPTIESRLVFNGRAGNGTYLTMPSNCAGGQVTFLHLLSQGPPFETEQTKTEAEYTTPSGATGCELVPFDPTISVQPQGGAVDSPEATTVDLRIPWDPNEAIANSYLQTAKVTLPEGMGLNPASANGLVACTDSQFGYHTNNPIECPDASKIGTVEVQTPSLPADSLTGDVYVGQPQSNDPTTGEQFRIFIHVGSTRYGVNVRLIGHVFPNLATGQLTAVVDENPQATFSSFKLRFNGGSKGTLTTPPTCGPNETSSALTPWSGQADATPGSSFTLSTDPSGGPCPQTLAARPFAPGYSAKSDSSAAGAFSPFHVNVGRADGEQELKAVNVTLPKGLTGKLAGIPYCSEAAIAAAQASTGTAELASYSCPAASEIGTTTTAAGSGAGPIKIDGKAFLAGPYKGAPLSMVIVTPGVAGPYDIGTVVVRVALNVNPVTAQINAVSDSIPNVFGGVKLDIRSIDVDVDRGQFMVNPTNCAAQATAGTISGGGSNPADPAAFSSYAVSAPYSATGCEGLAFKPKLHVRLKGGTKRNKFPQLRAILEARNGDANVARTALNLPHAFFVEQGHMGKVCTRPELASQTCPSNTVYGHAEAISPLLDGKLEGPVYLVPGGHTLPDLVADLRGQVNIQLHGVISSKHGGIKTVFDEVPDVPVTKFILNMRGGDKGLIVNSTNTCKTKREAILNIKGQNGKAVKTNHFKLNLASCPKGKGKK